MIRFERIILFVLLLCLLPLRVVAAPDPGTGAVTLTDILSIPKVGQNVTPFRQYFWDWANQEEDRRFQLGTFAARPAATALLRTKHYVVTDCNTTSCTAGGGSTRCGTYVNDSNAWAVAGCYGASTADVSSSVGVSVNNQIARFDGTTGKLIQNSTCTISDAGVIAGTCLLSLANLTDNATSGLCLLSGGAGGDPAYATCPGGGGGSSAFSALTSSTNTTAAMLVGTGAALGPTGTGTITANNVNATVAMNLNPGVVFTVAGPILLDYAGGGRLAGGAGTGDDLTLSSTTSGSPGQLLSSINLSTEQTILGGGNYTTNSAYEWLKLAGTVSKTTGMSYQGIQTFQDVTIGVGAVTGPYQFLAANQYKAGANTTTLNPLAFTNDTQWHANGFTNLTLGGGGGFHDHPRFVLSGGTFVAGASYNGFVSIMTPDTGLTFPNRNGFVFAQEDGAGSIDNQVGFVAADLTSNVTSTGFRSNMNSGALKLAFEAAGTAASAFSGPVTAGFGTNASLDVRPSATVNYTGQIDMCKGRGDSGNSPTTCVEFMADNVIIGTLGAPVLLRFDSTVTQKAAGGSGFPRDVMMYDGHLHTITDNSLGNIGGGSMSTVVSTPILRNATNDAHTNWQYRGFESAPTYESTGGGTMTAESSSGGYPFNTGFYAVSPVIGSSVTIPNYANFLAATAANSGTLTNVGMFVATAPGAGTNRHQFYLQEHTLTGVPETGYASINAQSGSPNRVVVTNESGHRWPIGYTSITGSGQGMDTTNTEYFTPVASDDLAMTTAEAFFQRPAPGKLHAFAISCGVGTAPGAGKSWILTLRSAGAGTNLSCTIADTTKSCTDREDTTPVDLADGALLAWEMDPVGTPATAGFVSCTLFFTVDAF